MTALALFSETAFSKLNYSNICQNEINIIEKQIDIPKGLLTAIGKTESGRFKDNKNVIIWPWTINTGKKSLFFDNKLQMKNFVINEIKKESQKVKEIIEEKIFDKSNNSKLKDNEKSESEFEIEWDDEN